MSLGEQFQRILEAQPVLHSAQSCLIAYSGGVDSHVLLHLCRASGLPVRAVHVHHGLQADADDWDRHCAEICRQLDIPYRCIHVDADPAPGESPEDKARNARYSALENELAENEVLLTAHHQDDQAETFLLQLMRAAGPAGLASMPKLRPFGKGYHARPLLGFSQQMLMSYAEQHHLDWVEDPSNADTGFDRNYMRREVMPVLLRSWPGANEAIARAAELQQDTLEIIDAMAAVDLAAVSTQQADGLSISKLGQLPQARQFNVLRYWINVAGMDKPRRNILQEVITSVLPASEDATPLVLWGSTEIRRYQDTLYVLPAINSHDIHHVYAWDGEQPLYIETLNMEMRLEQTAGRGLPQDIIVRGLTVRFRQGGEQLRPQGRQHTQSLKKLMQQAGIPPWQRNRIPLIYSDHRLVCVCGYWVADAFSVNADQLGWSPVCQSLGTKKPVSRFRAE